MNGGDVFQKPGVLGQNQYLPLSGQYNMPQWSDPFWRPTPVQQPQMPQATPWQRPAPPPAPAPLVSGVNAGYFDPSASGNYWALNQGD